LLSRHPATAHWGVPDPVEVEGTEAQRRSAFKAAYVTLRRRVELLLALPIEKLEKLELQTRLREIGQVGA
jgi:arsenate reductase